MDQPTANREFDVAILGSGPGGSLLAMALARHRWRVALIDHAAHPRFAVGESSTPTADALLLQLAEQFDLPQLRPLSSYGTWKKSHPELMCGLKRGFSYFGHPRCADFQPSQQLLVAASSGDAVADTHWLRSDVDHHLFNLASQYGVCQIQNANARLLEHDPRLLIEIDPQRSPAYTISAEFLIDATGHSKRLLNQRGVDDISDQLQTHSSALYGHFANVVPFETILRRAGVSCAQHPYPCDAAAVHHVLDDAWMWQLRFDDGSTSAGLMFRGDCPQHGNSDCKSDRAESLADLWQQSLRPFPLLAEQFAASTVMLDRTPLRQSARLQRLCSSAAGQRWAALPSSVGFVDPLHSTGLAHTISAVLRLARRLIQQGPADLQHIDLRDYSDRIVDELRWIDTLVEGCYRALPNFRLWSIWSMIYFAAATCAERQSSTADDSFLRADDSFLRADDRALRQMAVEARQRLQEAIDQGATQSAIDRFEQQVRKLIQPWNHVGLMDHCLAGMYRRTAAK